MHLITYEALRFFFSHQEAVVDVPSAKDYLSQCLRYLEEKLLDEFGDKIILYNVYFIEDTLLASLDYRYFRVYDSNRHKNWNTTTHFAFGDWLIKNKLSLSFTARVLEKELTSILLHRGKLTEYRHYLKDITLFDLGSVDISGSDHLWLDAQKSYDENFDTILEIGQIAKFNKTAFDEFVEKLILHPDEQDVITNNLIFHKLSNDIHGDNTTYFIRPTTHRKVYNAAIVLMFDGYVMTDKEFAEISLVISFLFSEAAFIQSEKEIKSRYYKEIADEQSHSWKHEFSALGTYINRMKQSHLRKEESEFEDYYQKSKRHLITLNKINAFSLALMRYGEEGENIEVDGKTLAECTPIQMLLRNKLTEAIETLAVSLEQLDFADESEQVLVLNKCIPKMLEDVRMQVKNIRIEVIRTGLEIILLDLLKNAIFHTNRQQPEVGIFLETFDAHEWELHITNNVPPSPELRELINQNEKHNAFSIAKQFKAGIRTVQRIAGLKFFNKTAGGWKLCISDREDLTDIFLKFPKSDVV